MTLRPHNLMFRLALALLLVPATAHAHLKLESSRPAQGDTIREPVREIRLTFSQAVPARYTVVTLVDAFGRELAGGTLAPVGASPAREYVLALAHPLMTGAFTVRWKTAGADGHAVAGLFDFTVDAVAGDAAATPSAAQQPSGHPPAHTAHHAESAVVPALYDPESSTAWILTRWLNFMALVLMVGAVAFRFGVLERARAALAVGLVDDTDAAVRRFAIGAAIAALVSGGLRLWLQSGSLHGPERMWQTSLLSALILETGWGKAWLAQSLASAGFMAAVLVRTRDRLDSWFSAAAFAVIAASTPAFSGHAAAVQQMAIVPIAADAIHVLAAASWLGTLAVLLVAAVPRAMRTDDGAAATATLVRAFSPLALAMGSVAVLTGVLNALVHIGDLHELWTTSYGRVLALKIGLVTIALTMGAYNWRVVKPRLGTDAATTHFRRSARAELAIAAIIILITGVLVATPVE